ncbi:alpha/beta hydrolase [Vibrio sp. SCSIO 43136]|uniref:DUF7379 domain-containing protein n=1 Tax=Vibrio sp. SCSIO 43136 TaxID=2819101 RepID=UPI002075642E|nr:alpha/beta hydrolase [Vibrio sp. SCSIO 43136]USD67591.1 hypothetical protein J4N39_15465 [Vibrio sp. SCSIO 43136]
MTIKQGLLLTSLALLTACSNAPIISKQDNSDAMVVVIHGLSRSANSMSELTSGLQKAGYQTCVMDYASVRVSMDSLINETRRQLDSCTQDANKVHLVGHSLGGLLIRYHLEADNQLQAQGKLGHVIMIGTPNQGSEVADHYAQKFWADWLGEVPKSLITYEDGFPQSLEQPNYDVGVIAGTKPYRITQKRFSTPNDGLVSVESTKLDQMKDYWEIELPHHELRSDPRVVTQVINYLQSGMFDHSEVSQ